MEFRQGAGICMLFGKSEITTTRLRNFSNSIPPPPVIGISEIAGFPSVRHPGMNLVPAPVVCVMYILYKSLRGGLVVSEVFCNCNAFIISGERREIFVIQNFNSIAWIHISICFTRRVTPL